VLDELPAPLHRPLAVERDPNPRGEPREEVRAAARARLGRGRERVEETRLLVYGLLDAAERRVKDAEEAVGEVRAGRVFAEDRGQVALEAHARELDSHARDARRRRALALQFEAQPEITPRAARDKAVPFTALDGPGRLLRLPRVLGQVEQLILCQQRLGRVGRDLDARSRRHLTVEHDAVPLATVEQRVERLAHVGARLLEERRGRLHGDRHGLAREVEG
jgi:hypothetical protein